jgi:D-glycero-D-manno-heptose 1,7-bisphosphate phosphatase
VSKAIFLDRDGVINRVILRDRRPFSPRNMDEFEILEKVSEAVALFQKVGLVVVVITNQPDLAKGLVSESLISEIHEKIRNEIGINHFYFCGHSDLQNCACRKPKVGMLLQASRDLGINLDSSYLVGDRWKDIKAGQEVGCKCYYIDNNYDEPRPSSPFYTVKSLYEAAVLVSTGKYDN